VERFAYYLLTYCALKLAYSCFTVPYTALTTELSPHDETRSSLTQFRTVFGIGAVLVGVVITGQILAAFPEDRESQASGYSLAGAITSILIFVSILVCGLGIKEPSQNYRVLVLTNDEENANSSSTDNLSNVAIAGNNAIIITEERLKSGSFSIAVPGRMETRTARAVSHASYFHDQKTGEKQIGSDHDAVAVAAAAVMAGSHAENEDPAVDDVNSLDRLDEPMAGSLLMSIVHMFTNKAYVILCLLAGFAWIGLNAVQSNLKLYLRYSVDLQSYFTAGLAVSLVSTMIAILLWRRVLPRLGKRLTFLIGVGWLAVTYLIMYLHPVGNVPMLFFTCFIHGVGVAVIYLIPWTVGFHLWHFFLSSELLYCTESGT
jgi:Na+/melibiose symporter-like transporter